MTETIHTPQTTTEQTTTLNSTAVPHVSRDDITGITEQTTTSEPMQTPDRRFLNKAIVIKGK